MEVASHPRGSFRFERFTLDANTGELHSPEGVIRLQPQPLKVLLALLQDPGQLVTREHLRNELAPDDLYGDPDHAINVAITKLRTALGESVEEPQFIETFARRGYRFLAPVTVLDELKPHHPEQPTREVPPDPVPPPRRRNLLRVAGAVGIVLAIIIGTLAAKNFVERRRQRARAAAAYMRLSVVLPVGASIDEIGGIAISPSGKTIVYAARPKEDGTRLFARRLDEWKDEEIEGTNGAVKPFFSPDGNWIAFANHAGLFKVAAGGGRPLLICGTSKCGESFNGGAWGSDGSIVFASGWGAGAEILRVDAVGGTPERTTGLREEDGKFFFSPELLPGAKHALVVACSLGRCNILEASIRTPEKHVVVEGASQPRYLGSGYLLYVSHKQLLAAPFDAEKLVVTGPAYTLTEPVDDEFDTASYAISDSGVLAVVREDESSNKLMWLDRMGNVRPSSLKPRAYRHPSLSPDGQKLAVTVGDGAAHNVWMGDLEREPLTQVTFGNDDAYSQWSADGRRIVFTSGRDGTYNLYTVRVEGNGEPERLTQTPHSQRPTSWHPSGQSLLVSEWAETENGSDIYELPAGSKSTRPFLKTRFNEGEAVFSPDGHWVSYESDETGRYEVYVRSYPGAGSKQQVSVEGGRSPRWNRNGHELVYASDAGLMSVAFTFKGKRFVAGTPLRLPLTITDRNFDVMNGAQLFLAVKPNNVPGAPSRIDVMVGAGQQLVGNIRHPSSP